MGGCESEVSMNVAFNVCECVSVRVGLGGCVVTAGGWIHGFV